MKRQYAAVLPIALALGAAPSAGPEAPRAPVVEDLMHLETVGSGRIAPDGHAVVYGVTSTDFEHDAYVTHLWLAPTEGGAPFQLTRGEKSESSPAWSPDGRWIAFTSPRAGDKAQIFAIRRDGGEAMQLTDVDSGVEDFEWSPDGRTIAFTASEPESEAHKAREKRFGDFDVVRREYDFVQLFTLDVAEALKAPVKGTARTEGHERSVGDFDWSPDGSKIAFDATVDPDLIQGGTRDLYVLELAGNHVTRLVSQPGPDGHPKWSPDGSRIAFESAMGRADFYSANGRIAVVPASGGTPRSLTDRFDEDASLDAWTDAGLWFQGLQKTASHLFRLDPGSGAIARVTAPDDLAAFGFSLSHDARRIAYTAASPTSMGEIYVATPGASDATRLTNQTAQLQPLRIGTRQVISWASKDGTTIEGVLVTPPDFDPKVKHPLLVVIHGGPTGVDRPTLLETRYYPVDVWASRGALVLKVNYRGSAGYGEKFRQLNIRNLGVGDAWDVVSGVESLVRKGWVDPSRVGCMGWSEGGYISAFLTTSTTTCAAVSVGAGISDWSTYYYNTDITPFTIQYLRATPSDDPAIYQKTSPITYIARARTPTLIQHGGNDRRVPIPNGYELRQALEDHHVPVEMVVYKGFGHPITKPRAMRAVMVHNLEWFNHYLWGDPAPDLSNPEGKTRSCSPCPPPFTPR